jgi:hypothetical protein
MRKQTKQDKALDRLVESAYYRTCSGVQIDIMDIGKVFNVGRAAILAGADKAGLERALVEFVSTICKPGGRTPCTS